MAREMDSVQAERAGRSHIAPVSLVRLTTYTDRVAGTPDKVFYFSDKAAVYDYGNTGTDRYFLPVIIGGGDFFSGIKHLSDPKDLTSFGQEFELRLSNEEINGSRLIETLRGHNLEGASIQIAQLFLTKEEMDGLSTLKMLDLTGYVGDEHTVLYRARVNRVSPVTDAYLTIKCTTELPTMAGKWNYVKDASVSNPIDVGLRLPRIYGEAIRTRVISSKIGFIGVMVDDIINSSETAVDKEVTDASGLPDAGTFILQIDDEHIECSKVDEKSIYIEPGGRGVDFTDGSAHSRGAAFIEVIDDSKWIASDRESIAIGTVYAKHRDTGNLVRINEVASTIQKNLADTDAVPGETVTSLSFERTGTMRQQPLTVVGTGLNNTNISCMDRVGVEEGSDATWGEIGSGNTAAITFDNPGTITDQTLYIDATHGAGTQDIDVYHGTTGGTKIGTITRVSLPANGSTPARFSFNTALTGNLFTLDPLIGSGLRIHNVEREIDLTATTINQTGESASTNIGGEDADNVIDGREDTKVSFSSSNNEYIRVTFPDPGISYDAQRIRIFGRFDTGKNVQIRTGFSSPTTVKDGNPAAHESIPTWHEWETNQVDDEIEIWVNTASDPGEVHLIERTLISVQTPTEVALSEEFFADVDGIPVPASAVKTWAAGETFDGGSWSVSGCTVAVDTGDKVEGTGSQKITIVEPSAVIQTESVSPDWSGGGTCTVTAVNNEEHTEGSNCIEGDSDTDISPCVLIFDDPALGLDLTDTGSGVGTIAFDFKIKKAGTTGLITVSFGSTADDWYEFRFDVVSDFDENTWHTVTLPIGTEYEIEETPDLSDINYFRVSFNGGNNSLDVVAYIDNVRVYRAAGVVIQNNAIGALDWSVPQPSYRIAVKPESSSIVTIDGIRVWISDDTWGTTVLGSDYRLISFPSALVEGDWATLESGATIDQNSVTHSEIRSMRIEIFQSVSLSAVQLRASEGATIRVDNFEIASTIDGAWKGTVGHVMSHPADIIRHWIEVVGGEDYDSDGYDALYASLGASAKWGFDVRALGFTWEEVLQRMAFEARCNVIPVETTAGRVWKMLAANNDYGFDTPAASAVITDTDGMSDLGRPVDDLTSYSSFRYAFDPSLPGGGNEEGFRLVLNATPTGSDVPIATADILAASKRFGAIESGPVAFRCIQDPDTAKDVAGYIVQERMANDRRVFELPSVAWFDALPYDVGDIVSSTPPWASSASTCRITSMTKAFTSNAWTITAVEVLEAGLRTP